MSITEAVKFQLSYMKEMALVIDEMYQYLYFEIIAVKSL